MKVDSIDYIRHLKDITFQMLKEYALRNNTTVFEVHNFVDNAIDPHNVLLPYEYYRKRYDFVRNQLDITDSSR